MEYTNSQDTSERTRVYLTVSFDSYKKISTENMYYDKFGEGRIYYKYLTPRAILGATSVEIMDLGRYKEADNNIKENIFCSLCDINDIHKKRLNNLDIEWTFETEDYSEDLKEFLKSTEMHMLVSSFFTIGSSLNTTSLSAVSIFCSTIGSKSVEASILSEAYALEEPNSDVIIANANIDFFICVLSPLIVK